MRRPGSAACLLALALAGPALARADSSLDGRPIVRIVVIRDEIFDTSDPATSSWPYRAANALHTVTRESFIRSLLLLREGEPYSEALAAESARLLRAFGWLNPVTITAREVPGGVEVTVHTHDQWTLEAGANIGIAGNRTKTGFSITERNLLGTGREVSVDYRSEPERDRWTYRLFDPLLLGTRWQARIAHEDSSDGFQDRWRVELPFYQLASSRAMGVAWGRRRLEEHLYAGSRRAVSGRHRSQEWRLWYGWRLPAPEGLYRRLVVGVVHAEDGFSGWRRLDGGGSFLAPEDRRLDGPLVRYESVRDRYEVVRGFRAWSVQEDLALGPSWHGEALVSAPAFGGDRLRLRLAGGWSRAWRRGDWVWLADTWASGRLQTGGPRNLVGGLQLALAQLGHRGWQARIRMEASRALDRERQLTLGADAGLRGWDPDAWDGTGRAVLNVQWRTLLAEEVLHVLSLGIVTFVDAGHTWGARVGPPTSRVRVDAGVGLLADLTHVGLAQLVRLEVAYPDDGSGPVVTLSSQALF